MTVTEFLEARIAEDDVDAAYLLGREDDEANAYGERFLAECAAKRWIIDLYELHRTNRDARRHPRARAAEDEQAARDRRIQEARTRIAEDAVWALAAVYSDHPDYDKDWAL